MDPVAAGCHSGPVTPSDDLFPPRRPIFFPVVIATVFLTIIGMVAGFVLGEQRRAADLAGGAGQQQQQQQGESPSPTPTSSACPPETSATAARLGYPAELRQVLRIETENGTTVWICQDPGGELYYQGKTGGLDTPLVEGENGLFLPDVVARGDDRYAVTAHNGNRIAVSRKLLEVEFVGGEQQTDRVVRAD